MLYNLYALLNVTTKLNNDEEGKAINSINTKQLIFSWQSKTKPLLPLKVKIWQRIIQILIGTKTIF